MRDRRWFVGLGVIAVGALALRIAYVLITKDPLPLGGDNFYYHHGANLLVDGDGFVDPFQLLLAHHRTPGAVHPPGYIVALAIPSLFRFRSVLDHQIWSCIIGAGTIVVVGFAGREIAGRRVGLIAAGLATVYPNMWFSDSVVMSETLIFFTTALTILVAYRFARRRTMWLAAVLGVSVGVTALTRAESILLVPLLVVPLVLLLRDVALRRRLELLGVSAAATLLTIAPWAGYNVVRFEHPVYLSSNLEITLLSANCNETYHGPFLGFFAIPCTARFTPPKGDASVAERFYGGKVREFVGDNKSRVPVVMLARLGRTFGFFNVNQQMTIDQIEGRELNLSRTGLGMFYALVAASVIGAIALRRRRVPLTPPLAVIVAVALTVAVVYGTTRFRAPAEVPLVLLGAVGIEVVVRRALGIVRDRRARGAREPAEQQPPSLATGKTRVLRILRPS
jgi:4-amino-4-deoxy-L-arabinose transferase-like glycosyltransferase